MPRRLVYLVACTLDGFVAGEDRGDPSGSPAFAPTDERLLPSGVRIVGYDRVG